MRFSVLILFLLLLTSGTLFAQDVKPVGGLSGLIKETLAHNPQILAAKFRYEAARARVAFFRNVPDPMVTYGYDKISPSFTNSKPMKTLGISQNIPFPTKLILREKSAQKEANAAQQEYKETQRSVIKRVKEAYFNLFLNRRKATLMKDSRELMGQFVDVATKKYEVGKISQQNILLAQVEYSKLSNNLILYDKEASVAKSLLLLLLGRDEDSLIDIPDIDPVGDIQLKEADIIELAKKNRPELQSYREMLGKAKIESSLSKQELLPDFNIQYQRDQMNGSFGSGQWGAMIGASIPLWFWGKQRHEIHEAKANFLAAQADYLQARNMTVYEVRSIFAQYEAARKLVSIYETGVLPQATSAVITARRAYESGSVSFLELLDSFRTLRDLQIEYFQSVADLQITVADLERFIGEDLWGHPDVTSGRVSPVKENEKAGGMK